MYTTAPLSWAAGGLVRLGQSGRGAGAGGAAVLPTELVDWGLGDLVAGGRGQGFPVKKILGVLLRALVLALV